MTDLLFQSLDCFHKLHLPLDNKHVNHANILDVAVLVKLFPQLGSALGLILWDVVLQYYNNNKAISLAFNMTH